MPKVKQTMFSAFLQTFFQCGDKIDEISFFPLETKKTA